MTATPRRQRAASVVAAVLSCGLVSRAHAGDAPRVPPPSAAPSPAPTPAPTPTPSPTAAPLPSPTAAPLPAPTAAPLPSPTAAPPTPADAELPQFAVAGPAGFGVVSADGASMLATHWLLQTDFRTFFNHIPTPERDTFALRFAGLRLDAVLERNYRAQLFVNFADNRVTVIETWIEARLARWARLRIGTFQTPISEERLTPGTALPFVSTSVAALLLPARDTGLQLLGTVNDVLSYNLALVNGNWAAGPGGSDGDPDKDLVGRVFVRPWARTATSSLRKLGLGVGASIGEHTGAPDNPRLLTLSSYGGQVVFAYKAPAAAAGVLARVVPHLTWGAGPFAIYADVVWTRERVAETNVRSRAFSAVASVMLTGEDAAPLAFVTPDRPFDPAAGHPGAIALVVGAGDVAIGGAAFPTLADPGVAMRGMTAVGAGLNWFLSRGVAVLTSYGHQWFRAAEGGVDRRAEDTLIARFQFVL
jgi:hypothetical protein